MAYISQLILAPPKKRVEISISQFEKKTQIFDYFEVESLSDFDLFIANQIGTKEKSLLTENHKKIYSQYVKQMGEMLTDENWWGTPLPESVKEVLLWKRYDKMQLLTELEEKVRDELKKLKDIQNIQPKRRLGFNSLEIGVFDFDAASMGLTKMMNNEGVLRTVTTNPKSFAYFPKVKVQRKVINFYILVDVLGYVAGDQMIYNGLSAIIMAEYFLKQGYSVQINIVYGTKYGGIYRCAIVKAKQYDNSMNREKIATLTSDPKFYRGKGFISLIAINNYFHQETDMSFGGGVSEDSFRNFCLNVERKNKTVKTVIIHQSFSMDTCVQEVRKQVIFLIRIQKYDEFAMQKYRRYYEDLPEETQKEIKAEVDRFFETALSAA